VSGPDLEAEAQPAAVDPDYKRTIPDGYTLAPNGVTLVESPNNKTQQGGSNADNIQIPAGILKFFEDGDGDGDGG
jgi:hypothetical protein